MAMTNPTRRSMRHDIVADAILHIADMAPVAVTVCNISRHGLVIDSLACLSDDMILHVELEPGRLRAARCVWQDGFRAALDLVEPFRSEEYWRMLRRLANKSAAA